MAKQKKHNWFTSLSFGTVALVLTVLLVLGYLSIIVPPEKAWFFTLFGLIYPVVLPATLILFVIALVRRSRTRLVLALALLPSLFLRTRKKPSGCDRARKRDAKRLNRAFPTPQRGIRSSLLCPP